MPQYAYRAVDWGGAPNRGVADAADEHELFQSLRQQGLSLVACQPAVIAKGGHARLSLSDQAVLCRHLQAMLQAGIPFQTALEDIIAAHPDKKMKAALQKILRAVASGTSLSTAFANADNCFDPLFPLLLKAGEKTGHLQQSLSHLQDNLDWKDMFQQKLRKTLSYPLVQLTLAALAVAVLVGVAIPQIVQLLAVMGSGLPWYAEILLFTLKAFGFIFLAILVGILASALLIPILRRANDGWARQIDALLLRLPLIGPVLMKAALTQMMHLFAAMLASGMQVMEVLEILPQLTSNRALGAELAQVKSQVEGGRTLTHAFQKGMQLPAYVVRLLKVGEDGGDIIESLRHIAALYQRESQQAADALLKGTSLSITLIVGLVLIAMVLGVMYPLYQGLSTMVANG